MATEVTCGQCQGRLLVETLGVVVACPHCGVHLSIPAPEPVPAPIPVPEPAPVPAPAPVSESSVALTPPPRMEVPPIEPVPNVSPSIAPVALEEFTSNVNAAATVQAPMSPDAPRDDLNTSSVLSEPEPQAGGPPENPAEIGWHSAPNLYLSAREQPAVAAATPVVPQPPVFTASAETSDSTAAASGQPVAAFPSFGEPAAPTEPAWSSAPPPQVSSPDEKTLFFSASQQFSLGSAEQETAPQTRPEFVFTAAAQTPNSEALPPSAPATSQPLLFEAAALVSKPVGFSEMASASPGTFGGFSATPQAPSASELPTTTVAQEAASFAENEVASRLKFMTVLLIVVGSYASAVTIVLVYMLIFGRTNALESLPDLKPPKNKNGDITWRYNPAANDVAPGHVLSLGQSRRFGNVRVTPIKVTRGTVKFEHYTGKQDGFGRGPSEPLLKLWLKFENVSRDQTFAPVDSLVLYTRQVTNLGQSVKANCFLATEADRRKGKSLFYIFEMPVHSEFRMVGQNLNRELGPGDTFETFIPSEEEARDLKGDLVWRIWFRKGYNPESLRGVTTLIDVRFNSSDIVEDRAA